MSIFESIKRRSSSIVLALLVAGVFGYEWHQTKSASLIARAEAKELAKPAFVLAEGRIVAYPGAEVTLGAELSGKITKLDAEERAKVTRGQLLAEIDVKEQRAALQEAWSRVREADEELSYFGTEQARSSRLLEQQVIAESAFDKSRHDARAAAARKTSFLASAARLDSVLSKAKVLAPIDGTVTTRFVDAGEMVAGGTPLLTITNLDKLRVEAEVGEFDAARVRLGAAVTLEAEGYDGQHWKGSVEEIPDQVVARNLKPLDPSRPVDTRVLLVKIKLAEAVPLKLGQRVDVHIAF